MTEQDEKIGDAVKWAIDETCATLKREAGIDIDQFLAGSIAGKFAACMAHRLPEVRFMDMVDLSVRHRKRAAKTISEPFAHLKERLEKQT